eukprot:snap_masked-scaffold_7-processed-gene-9.15-mRNA-1 protein AED:0.08 eAED:0.08 QI:0/-1/0/1/-1/1/1/0/334
MDSTAAKLQPFVCGGIAAMFASSCIHPIDLVKVRIQLQPNLKPSIFSVAKNVVKTDGVTGLYSGLSAALTRQATYGTARIGLHRVFSNKLTELNKGEDIPFLQKSLSGMLSGAIAVCIGTPFDVSLVRMQNDGSKPAAERRNYKNVFDAVMRISREEGLLSLWKGLGPNILRGMSMNVGMLACYDEAKQMVSKVTSNKVGVQLGSSAVAGFCCAFLSLPFDLLKSRMQNMKVDPKTGKYEYKGMTDCFVQIGKKEGVFAYWRGFTAYYGRCAPHSMIILLTIEQVKSAYEKAFGLSTEGANVDMHRFSSTGSVADTYVKKEDFDDEVNFEDDEE